MGIEESLKAHEQELLSLPHVSAVGIGHVGEKEVILVFVRPAGEGSEQFEQADLPKSIDGYEVLVQPELHIGGSG